MRKTEDTLHDYFQRGLSEGVIDYSLRVVMSPEGCLDFYLHPSSRNGETGDFSVNGGFVRKLEFGAGSSRPVIRIVGSGLGDSDD